jgi:D-sedoheptulose 7-phosphate isomerase
LNVKAAMSSHALEINDAIAINIANLEKLKALAPDIGRAADIVIAALRAGRTIYFCGNGGSAADAQHLAAELSGRFLKNRRALPGVSLTTNTSAITAIGNDFGYDEVFSRQLEGVACEGDVLVALSTSGNSVNVVKAVDSARARGVKTIALTGAPDSALSAKCEICLKVPSAATPRIQEMHIVVGHIICELAENAVA